jgi:hypothetical protein
MLVTGVKQSVKPTPGKKAQVVMAHIWPHSQHNEVRITAVRILFADSDRIRFILYLQFMDALRKADHKRFVIATTANVKRMFKHLTEAQQQEKSRYMLEGYEKVENMHPYSQSVDNWINIIPLKSSLHDAFDCLQFYFDPCVS